MCRMGPEPIHADFTAGYLAGKLAGRTAAVKSLLLDQGVCCGVGNIYSDEALHRAGVRPTRRAGELVRGEVVRLAAGLRSALRDGIRWCGTTMDDKRYVRPGGRAGRFQERLAVFHRDGEACLVCGATIRRVRVGNRSSHYCPRCQK
jgi:formamidopyrimidine-DNA glycosylase